MRWALAVVLIIEVGIIVACSAIFGPFVGLVAGFALFVVTLLGAAPLVLSKLTEPRDRAQDRIEAAIRFSDRSRATGNKDVHQSTSDES